MSSLIQKHAHVKGQRSNHHIFKFPPNPSWAKKRPNRYTSFGTYVSEYLVLHAKNESFLKKGIIIVDKKKLLLSSNII